MLKKLLPLIALFALGLLLFIGADAEGAHVWPKSGVNIRENGKLKLDVSNTSDGYFMAAVTKKNSKKLKLRVQLNGETYTYDLNGKAEYEVFPLQLGNGKYEITLYENVSGKKYASAGKLNVTVNLTGKNAPFLCPSQYVNYTELSAAVEEAYKRCDGKSEKEKYKIICSFMRDYFGYDYKKATTVKTGELPDIDGSYKKRMGICQDLSAIMCCMLRTQGIPAKLMIGYADKIYHAWVICYPAGNEEFFDPTVAVSGSPMNKVKSYTAERFY